MGRYVGETPFDTIEGSHEYISMLAEEIEANILDVAADLALADAEGADRRIEALQLVMFKLKKLNSQMLVSRRILNDLRTLRRLLMDERNSQQTLRATAAG
jgi:hypothetical protein